LVRRTKVAGPVAALLHGSASAAVREAAARLACSPAWRDAIAEAATEYSSAGGGSGLSLGLGGSARAVESSVRRGGGAGGGGTGDPKPGSPFFVVGGFDRGLDDGGADGGADGGTDGDDGHWKDRGGDGDRDDEWAPLERTGSVLSASRLEPRPAGSGGIKGRELRNSVM